MGHFDQIYIGGEWGPSASSSTIPVVNPATEEVIAAVPAGSAGDAERAVTAARGAFGSWGAMAPAERAKYVTGMGDALGARSEELTLLICKDVGTPRQQALAGQVNGALALIARYADAAQHYPWVETEGTATIGRRPKGVVAAITPWNAPLQMVMEKVAPALLAGCTVVLKPSEVAPLAIFAVAEAAHEAGLPAGVFNLLSGTGPSVGEAAVRHPEVDMISFTGSTRAGSRIAALAAERTARVVLEMGGKSATILLDDASLDQALKPAAMSCYTWSGQVCAARTRLLVHRGQYAEAVERLKAITEQVSVGDPATQVDLGPLVSRVQQERVRGYINRGIAEGARLVTGGPDAPEGLEKGFFVRPTLFADVSNSMTIAREEIFGPVLCVIPYDNDDDAVRIANDSPYGLSGDVWSADPDRARRVAWRLRTGEVRINGQAPGKNAPFGGFKQSGIGRTGGRFGLDEYVELQSINAKESSV